MARTKITTLTPEQEAQIPVWREAWRAIGLSSERIVPDEARSAIRELYASAGMAAPKAIFVAQSPMQALLMRAVIQALGGDQLRDQLRDQLWGQLRDQLGDQLWGQLGNQLGGQLWDQLGGQLGDQLWGQLGDQLGGQLGGQLWGQLGGQLGDQLRDQLRGQLRNQLGDQLRDQLRDQLWDQLRGQLRDQLRDQLWGQLGDQLWGQLGDQLGGQLRDQLYQAVWMVGGWDSFWLAFYEAGRSVGATYPETLDRHLDAYIRYAKTCGVAFCYRDMAFIADRPVRLRFDEARRLHADDGAALAWSDGYGVYAWHGYRIPDTHHWIIADKARLTVQAAMAERNAELRRIMLEIVGFERVAAELGATVVDQDVNCGQPRRLLRAEVGGETLAILHVVNGSLEPNGTRREFHLGALSEARTCHEAVAMSYGRASHSYQEAGRT